MEDIDFQGLEHKCKNLENELKKVKDELEIEKWGALKTNQAIKFLYKELDKQNRDLQSLDQLKTDFINIASHELRTPLAIIKEAVSQLLDGLHGSVTLKQRDFLMLCLGDVDRLKRLIDDLLDISKIEAGQFKLIQEHVDIVSLARRVMASFSIKARSANLELRENFPSKEAMAFVDKDSIIRVFTNLIGNAMKFTVEGYIEVSVEDKADSVHCAVSDTGRGISEYELPKLFSKFQQFGTAGSGAEKGSGLGLNISKGLLDLHHADIWVESSINKGTKFTFTLLKQPEQKKDSDKQEV